MWRYRAVIICLVGTIAGCVQYHAAPLKLRAGADEFAARRLADVQLRDELVRLLPQAVSPWPPREWDRAELLAVALTQNPQLAVARAQVKETLSREITAAVTVPTIGIGASAACDGQVLVIDDVLGLSGEFKPKLARRYVDLGSQIAEAARTYAADVKAHRFPGPENVYGLSKTSA